MDSLIHFTQESRKQLQVVLNPIGLSGLQSKLLL